MGIVITLLVVCWVVYMIVKKYYPQAVLLTAGIILLFATYCLGTAPILAAKESSGSMLLDIFHTIKVLLS